MPHITFDLLLFIIISINLFRIFYVSFSLLAYWAIWVSRIIHSIRFLLKIYLLLLTPFAPEVLFPSLAVFKKKSSTVRLTLRIRLGAIKWSKCCRGKSLCLLHLSIGGEDIYNAGLINIFFFLFLLITRFDSAEISLLISLWDIAQILSRVFLVFN